MMTGEIEQLLPDARCAMPSIRRPIPPVPAEAILVVDAGTSSLRAVSVGCDGDVQLLASEPWEMRTPRDAQPFGREFEPDEVIGARWRDSCGRPGDSRIFAAVAFTGQREGLVFLDAADRALYAGPNIDARASAEGMEIDADRGDKVYQATGHLPSLMQAPAKFRWLRRHRPESPTACAVCCRWPTGWQAS